MAVNFCIMYKETKHTQLLKKRMLSLSSAFGLLCNIYYKFYLIPFIPVYYLFVNLYLFDSFCFVFKHPSPLCKKQKQMCTTSIF